MPRRLGVHQIDAVGVTDGKVPTVTGGVLVYATPTTGSARSLLPLTTAIGGAPEDVWDANDERVLTEAVA